MGDADNADVKEQRISSPEELHDYMRVTNPRLWMILATIIALLAGFFIFASVTVIENKLNTCAHVRIETVELGGGGTDSTPQIYIEIPEDKKSVVKIGQKVIFNDMGIEGEISYIQEYPFISYAYVVVPPDYLEMFEAGEVPNVSIMLETISPISFLFN